MIRKILSVIAGVLTGFVIVFVGDATSHKLYAPPANINYMDKKMVEDFMATIPSYVFVVMVLFWILSSFLGGLIAARINRPEWKSASLITGGILMAAALLNFIMLPHPFWVVIATLVLYLPAAYLGGYTAKPLKAID